MNKVLYALAIAVLLVSTLLQPATAAPLANSCGDTYTVQHGDYLKLIANYCGVSYTDILYANPQIGNPNWIYPGQIIRLVSGASIPDTSTPTSTSGTYVVQWGDTLSQIARNYGVSLQAMLDVNPQIQYSWLIYTGQVINLPSGSTSGSSTSTGYPYDPYYGYYSRRITISTRYVAPGGSITVTAYGFPANTPVDIRLNKRGEATAKAVDAKTDSRGYVTDITTMPTTAVKGEVWEIHVLTTEIRNGVEVISPAIYITD